MLVCLFVATELYELVRCHFYICFLSSKIGNISHLLSSLLPFFSSIMFIYLLIFYDFNWVSWRAKINIYVQSNMLNWKSRTSIILCLYFWVIKWEVIVWNIKLIGQTSYTQIYIQHLFVCNSIRKGTFTECSSSGCPCSSIERRENKELDKWENKYIIKFSQI